MNTELVITEDGSHTIYLPDLQVTYHSTHGSIQESNHVFINAGLEYIAANQNKPIRIFEMGLGTGLNALLTGKWTVENNIAVDYVAIELFPLPKLEVDALNYVSILHDVQGFFSQIHNAEWGKEVIISPLFKFLKLNTSLLNYTPTEKFNLIYFDAFAPLIQPELWTTEVFIALYNLLNNGGVLTTYCSKSDVRRSMMAAGFTVEKIPGPPGKREMVRAMKK
ncbi:MAG: tRNA (5-methylaminomethyl-2-thiouridine)(34)-methyltransferase MnmD [Bacteroidota bacterium]